MSTAQKIVFLQITSSLMNNINVFLCQSDKETHVRIGEIFISPILKLFRQTCWITSWLIEVTQHGGGHADWAGPVLQNLLGGRLLVKCDESEVDEIPQ